MVHDVELRDERLAPLLKRYQACGGPLLFQCEDETRGLVAVDSDDVNDYLRAEAGDEFTAKDFRTWQASAVVAGHLFEALPIKSVSAARKTVRQAIEQAALKLGNTKTVCRKSYVHPDLIAAYEDGRFAEICDGLRPMHSKWMSREERVLLHVLDKRARSLTGSAANRH